MIDDRFNKGLVSDVLKWLLLAVAILTFALMAWATVVTYITAPPQPERFVTDKGNVLITSEDILAGKAGAEWPGISPSSCDRSSRGCWASRPPWRAVRRACLARATGWRARSLNAWRV